MMEPVAHGVAVSPAPSDQRSPTAGLSARVIAQRKRMDGASEYEIQCTLEDASPVCAVTVRCDRAL